VSLVIVTAGGFGRELAAYARDAGFEVKGFLHDLEAYPGSLDDYPTERDQVLGSIDGYEIEPGDSFAIGLGDVAPRVEAAERLVTRGAELATVIHPSAWVAPSARVGAGVAVCPFACVGPDAEVGDLGLLNVYASAGHDARLGRASVLAPYGVVGGHGVLEDEVFLATHAVVAPRRRVGEGSVVSAGSVALRDVPPRSLALGNPARSRELYPERGKEALAGADHSG
jgi:sugar O-acyltransferase (sialic acid O-acetyltransferase NeuD family)